MNNQIKILDVKIDVISKREVLEEIKKLLTTPSNEVPSALIGDPSLKRRGEQLVTTNPEFIIAAQKDEEFKNIINNSWLSVVDGHGIRLAAKYLQLTTNNQQLTTKLWQGFKVAWWGIVRNEKKLDVIKEVITGTDLVPEIVKEIKDIKGYKDIKIFLLGGFDDVPKLTAEILKQQYNNITIEYSIFEIENIIDKINQVAPQVLFVALNHPRAQKWISENLPKMPAVKLAMGVGGAFDYLSGKIKRAPTGWRGAFEWLYRLICQPKRWFRIWKATVKFPWLVFKSTLINTDRKHR